VARTGAGCTAQRCPGPGPRRMPDVTGDGPPVVVGVDPSDSARDAAFWAADLAAARGCGLLLLHLTPSRSASVPGWLREIADAAERAGAAWVTAEVACGTPFDVLLTRSHRAAMVVVGSFGRDAPVGMLVGSTAPGLAARAGCPVAVVRGTDEGMPPPRRGPVLVGVGGTPDSDPALHLAGELAAGLGAGLVVVHARSDTAGGRADLGLEEQLQRVVPGLPVERRIVADTALRALLDLAGTARMVVVARRGHVPAAGVRLGSTTRGLVEFAPCPVVVAPGPRTPA